MQRIVPSLWFDHVAAEAAEFYTTVFSYSRVTHTQHYPLDGLPDWQAEYAGQVLTVEFEIGAYRLVAINAGAEFRINPSVSFLLNFDPAVNAAAREHLNELWGRLSEGGRELMPLAEYPFSRHYGWLVDRYGVSWQLALSDPGAEPRPFVVPSLLFGDVAQNRAGEAIDFYTSLFEGRTGTLAPYPEATGPARAGSLQFGEFEVLGQWFAAMDSGVEQDFTFNPGVSLILECADQAELDRYWEQLSAVREAEQCGWCVDRFGLSWQVVPAHLAELLAAPGAYARLLEMKKIDIAALG